MKPPVIVMGMMRSGTTLLAEMIHKGGTPMFAGDFDPGYDSGIKYERKLTHQINLSVMGLSKNREGIKMIDLPICQPPTTAQIEELAREVGEGSWGFKDPRTTLSYPMWCEIFPMGPRAYVYRNHQEILRHYFNRRGGAGKRMRDGRRAALAWAHFNERVLANMKSDREAGRPHALVSYEELMQQTELIGSLENALEVPLADARNWDLRRNKVENPRERRMFRLLSVGLDKRIDKIYAELGALRLSARVDGDPPPSVPRPAR